MSYGLKITKPGINVGTATEPRDFIFNSEYSSVKIALEGTSSVTIAAGGTSIGTITHSLNFVPLAMVFSELNPSSGRYYQGAAFPHPADDVGPYMNPTGVTFDYSKVDNTKLYVSYINAGTASKTVKFKYYIFADSG